MLHALLDANLLQYGPEYQGHLSNHLPMALHALHSLGASPHRLQAFYASYAPRLQHAEPPIATPRPGTDVDWLTLRGQPDTHAALLAHFNGYIALHGMQATLAQAVPALMPGVSAAAFHGVIRTAHAWQAGHARELAAGLAYWAYRWQPLPAPTASAAPVDFAVWSEQLIALAPAWKGQAAHNIAERMLAATSSAPYQQWAGALRPTASVQARIAELAALAVARYVATPNFTVLHLITGLHAVRMLLPWVVDSEDTQGALAHSVFAAYMAAQVRPGVSPVASDVPSWPAVVAAALGSDNDHVIKLVHACREEASAYGEGLYLRAAGLPWF